MERGRNQFCLRFSASAGCPSRDAAGAQEVTLGAPTPDPAWGNVTARGTGRPGAGARAGESRGTGPPGLCSWRSPGRQETWDPAGQRWGPGCGPC